MGLILLQGKSRSPLIVIMRRTALLRPLILLLCLLLLHQPRVDGYRGLLVMNWRIHVEQNPEVFR